MVCYICIHTTIKRVNLHILLFIRIHCSNHYKLIVLFLYN
nr:MAG TPA: hypothetical protein [Caudoviricetes sp.]